MINSEETMIFREYDDVVTVNDVMKMLHIGKSNVYKLLKDNSIKSVKVGKRFIIPKRSVIEFVTIQ
jgi:excisionase family DNA binding protein